jgi:hypothetical protein
MARCLAIVAVALLATVLRPVSGFAQIEPRTCGVLDGPGCNPNQCGVLDGPGCQAQTQVGGFGENMQLTLGTRAALDAKKPDGEVNTIGQMFAVLRACWSPPASENAQRGMQMSMRFSFNTAGKLIGAPRVTYSTREVSQKTRDMYRDAFAQSLQGCTPLSFTRSFAGAIAGRPIVVRIIDNRDVVGPPKRQI